MSTATLAAIRFGTGLSPVLSPPDGADALLAGLAGPDTARKRFPVVGLAKLWPLMAEYGAARRESVAESSGATPRLKAAVAAIHAAVYDGMRARLSRGALAEDGFRERLTWFWADHFTVRATNIRFLPGPATYVEEAIRPHLGGPFSKMLRAAAIHPVMLSYLDQDSSIGPMSQVGQRDDGGLNEKLAREILELHTLGVGAHFTQEDVTQFAELLTGLTFSVSEGFRFRPLWAEPGAEHVLGTRYGGKRRARRKDIFAALDDIAHAPATAAHLAQKLAVHFVSDTPDPDMVMQMTHAYLVHDTDLSRVYEAMLAHPAAWAPLGAKARQPFEYVTASLRALGTGETRLAELTQGELTRLVQRPLARMGQPYEQPPGPNGWPEEAEAWITPPALAERIGWAMNVKALHGGPLPEPNAFVEAALGDLAPEDLAMAVRMAESKSAGVGLVLASPAFNRR